MKKILYEDSVWRVYRCGTKFIAVIIERFHSNKFMKKYEIRLPAFVNPDFDWWLYGYSINTTKSRKIISTPVPNTNDIVQLIRHKSKFDLPEVVIDELNAISIAEKMVYNG